MLTVLEILKRTTEFFVAKGIESPRLNAELLVGHALGLKRMQLYLQFERPLTEGDLGKIRPLVRRRAQHEPLQYIIGETEFCGLRLKTDRRALIPRPETELLIEHVVQSQTMGAPSRILDMGTGSGAIALALARAFPLAAVVAVDISDEALALAAENAAATELTERVRFLRSRWYDAVPGVEPYQVIVANPPYLSAEETAQTRAEVRDYEPAAALTSADDGLADLREIIAETPRFLAPGGMLAMETGIGHHARLMELLGAAGYDRSESRRDLAGRDRYVLAWKA